ncbi:MAG: hypothetical protein VCF24_16815 [Candidatus Latescibacterota bacterium]
MKHLLPIGAALGALLFGCTQHSEERIVVASGVGADSFEDRTGMVWDLTFARDEVGMNTDTFTGGGGIGRFPYRSGDPLRGGCGVFRRMTTRVWLSAWT